MAFVDSLIRCGNEFLPPDMYACHIGTGWVSRSGDHFTKGLWTRDWNLLKILFVFIFYFECSEQVTILHMSWQITCRDMCKIVTWLVHNYLHNGYIFYEIMIYNIIILKWNGSLMTVVWSPLWYYKYCQGNHNIWILLVSASWSSYINICLFNFLMP